MSLYINGRKWPDQIGTNIKQYYGDGNSGHIWYNGTQFDIGTAASKNLRLVTGANGYVQIGTGTPDSGAITTTGTFYVSSHMEVDGSLYADSHIYMKAGNAIVFASTVATGGCIAYGADDGTRFACGYTDGAGNRNFIFTSSLNYGKDHDHETLSANPTIFLHSATDPDSDPAQWLSFAHTQSDAVISTGKGKIILLPVAGSPVQVGDAGSTSHTLNANDDLFVSGKFEADGLAYFDNEVAFGDDVYSDERFTIRVSYQPYLVFDGFQDDGSHIGIGSGDGHGNHNLIICSNNYMAYDYDHETLSANPTIFHHSATNPDTNNLQYGYLVHDTTSYIIGTGLGPLTLKPATDSSVLLDDNGNDTNSTPLELTANSGGTIQSATLQCMYGADPYLRICAPNDAGTATGVIDMHDTVIAFVTDNQVDIGATGANRPKDYYGSGKAVLGGDIEAAGGYQTQLNYWYQDDVAASQSAVVLNMDGNTSRSEVPTIKAGSVVGLAVYSNAARAAGTLTCQVTIDGTAITGHDAVLDGSATQTNCVTIAKDAHTFTAGQRIGVKLTTDGDWLPTTADITVTVLIEQ